jgi:Fe2+ or Zn2+ uptake regulation protein
MNEEERRNMIIEYITRNQGCMAEDIVKGLRSNISRVVIYRILPNLVADGHVQDSSGDRRSHRYYVDTNNPLITIPKEMDHFKDIFFSLADKAKQQLDMMDKKIQQEYPKQRREPNLEDDGYPAEYVKQEIETMKRIVGVNRTFLILYHHLVGMCLIASIFKWNKAIHDKKSLRELNSEVFHRLEEMQLRLSDLFPSSENWSLSNEIIPNFFGLQEKNLKFIVSELEKVGLEMDLNPVMDFLWDITKRSIPSGALPYLGNTLKGVVVKRKLKDWKEIIHNELGK